MPAYDTPQPISADIAMTAGEIRIVASDRRDTVVTIAPADAFNDRDVRDAEDTEVDFTSGRLTVRGPRSYSPFRRAGTPDVTIELPAGSAVDARLGAGAIRCTGPLGDTRLKSGAGDLQVEDAASLRASTGFGVVSAGHVAGDADLTTASGRLTVQSVGGRAGLSNSNGDTWIGAAGGALVVKSANGSITAARTTGRVTANTAVGDIRLAEVVQGDATLKTAAGRIEIGISRGTAARLDLHTDFGRVVNELDATSGPGETDHRAEVTARTSFGDIVIQRSVEAAS
ncbi:DUF4097 family beta strand repeat-containing protein [Cryptosporangium japonicum]|uniref:DUF4097 family beta strand repeat-containing protein n=1 Tax=Cryptosporangium japonicum TaxID=80872 RepID=A0ABP3DJR0_9ACTN